MKKRIYIFSGLGADERAFQHLDFSGYDVHFMKWEPTYQVATLEEYAKRFIPYIDTDSPILIGLSFGGMLAIEVAKQINTSRVIIIASAKNRKEIPCYYRCIGRLALHRLIPIKFLLLPNFITNYMFGATTSYEKKMLSQILRDTDPVFLKWAIDKILKWDNSIYLSNVYHIHGTKDRILPCFFTNPNSKIKGGGHLMTISMADEIMEVLRRSQLLCPVAKD